MKPKVLMLGWEFPPVVSGGLGVACLGIAKALSKFVDLTVILPKADENFSLDNVQIIGLNQIKHKEVKVELEVIEEEISNYITLDDGLFPYPIYESHVTSHSYVKEHLKVVETQEEELVTFQADDLYGGDLVKRINLYTKYVLQIAQEREFDVIYAHDWMTFSAGLELKYKFQKPLAVHVHSLSYDRSGPESRGWIYDIECKALHEANAVIPVSFYTGGIIINHLAVPAKKVYPIHNGIEDVEIQKDEKVIPEKIVLFLGRITLQKGPEFFLEIASEVLKKYENVRFVMAGTGDKMKGLIMDGAYRQVGTRFHFTGFLTKDKVHRLLSMTDVYCMPSVSEPFGLSAIEAAQFGIPCVISKQSGAAEVLTGALKSDFWDVTSMSKHIVKLLSDEQYKDNVVAATSENLKTITWENAAASISQILINQMN